MRQQAAMVEESSFESDGVRDLKTLGMGMNLSEVSCFRASAGQSEAGLELNLAGTVPTYVRLDLENLNSFEVVERQFEKWGAIFGNAIAINPSNPAFPTHSGRIVLMGAPKSGLIEATFLHPVRFVSGFVTSSRRTVLSAYDSKGIPIAHTQMSGPNLAGSNGSVPPNAQLCLSVANIHRITFYAFDGQLTMDNFSFCF